MLMVEFMRRRVSWRVQIHEEEGLQSSYRARTSFVSKQSLEVADGWWGRALPPCNSLVQTNQKSAQKASLRAHSRASFRQGFRSFLVLCAPRRRLDLPLSPDLCMICNGRWTCGGGACRFWHTGKLINGLSSHFALSDSADWAGRMVNAPCLLINAKCDVRCAMQKTRGRGLALGVLVGAEASHNITSLDLSPIWHWDRKPPSLHFDC